MGQCLVALVASRSSESSVMLLPLGSISPVERADTVNEMLHKVNIMHKEGWLVCLF